MSSIPVGEIVQLLGVLGREFGVPLLDAARRHRPDLDLRPVPDAAAELDDARDAALARARQAEPPGHEDESRTAPTPRRPR